MADVRYPDGHCQECGEPLRALPWCPNCRQRAGMAE
jgi:predicted amidophosphoribosyltransferase